MDERWTRECEARLARLEEQVKGITPLETVRQMLRPLEDTLDSFKGALQALTFNVTNLVGKIEGLADSDRRLTEQHNSLMAQRARDEQELHRLERQGLELANQKLQEELERLRKVPRGFVIWIKEKATPTTGFVIAICTILTLAFAAFYWLREHIKP